MVVTHIKDRIRGWLLDHPEVLTGLFLLLMETSDFTDTISKGGSEAFMGP